MNYKVTASLLTVIVLLSVDVLVVEAKDIIEDQIVTAKIFFSELKTNLINVSLSSGTVFHSSVS